MKREKSEKERKREREIGEVWCCCTYWIAPQGTGRHPAPGVGGAAGLLHAAAHAPGARLPGVGSPGGVRVSLHTPRVARCKRTQRRGKRIPTSIQGVTADASKLISISRL